MPGSVLCVDNDRALVQILAKALESEGYRVQVAYDGEAAVELATRERPGLVLLDLILPRRDGFEVLEAIRHSGGRSARLPVVLLSGCTPTREYQKRAERLEAAAFLTKPLPLEQLLELVAWHIRSPHAEPGSGGTALSGTLDSLPFPSLLHHLRGLRATGVLHLSAGQRRKWLELVDGRPTAVRSNLVNECLGNFLLRTERISREVFEESRRLMAEGSLQGEILVAMDVLSEKDVPAVLRAQAEEKLFEIFSWPSGSYRFEVGGRLQRANQLTLQRSMANLILDGVGERMPLERIDAWLRENAASVVTRAESPFYRYQEIDLRAEHLRLIRWLATDRPMTTFLEADPELRRALYGLLATGMLELSGASPGLRSRTQAPQPSRPRREESVLRAELTELAGRLGESDPFEALQVSPGASDAEIHQAYEALLGRIHPDQVRSDAVARLAELIRSRLRDAFEALNDPERRSACLRERRRRQQESRAQREARAALEAERDFQAGEAALRHRDFQQALGCFGRAVERYPQAGEYHAHYGWTLHLVEPRSREQLRRAIRHVRKGLKLAGESEKSYLYMGRLLNTAGRTDVAEKMFSRAVQIRPECTEALREIRLIHMRREKSKGLVQRLLRR